MSIENVKTMKRAFVDFLDFVDPQDAADENEEDVAATAVKPGTCTWPVCRLRHPSTPGSDEETAATRTPDNEDAHSGTGELEDAHCEAAALVEEDIFFGDFGADNATERAATDRVAADPVATPAAGADRGLWLDDDDPASPCAISMWQTAAASFYLPSPPATPAGGLGPVPMLAAEPAPVAAEPSFLPGVQPEPCGWTAARAAILQAVQETQPTASAAGSAAAAPRSLQELRSEAASLGAVAPPTRSFGGAPARVSTKLSSTAPAYAVGDAFVHAASVGPVPWASSVSPPRADVVAPQMPSQGRRASAAKAAKVRCGQPFAEGAQKRQGFQKEDPNRLERRRHPAKQRADDERAGPVEPIEERTTIMLRNIPNDYTRDMLHELIETRGFGGKCDFLYLPMDFHTQSNLGYAFVNLERPEDAWRFWQVFEGFSKWAVRSKKVGSLRWSECQGLEANVKRYRNSPVMGDSVPECHKPAIYVGGERVAFPAPTKHLRAPRIK